MYRRALTPVSSTFYRLEFHVREQLLCDRDILLVDVFALRPFHKQGRLVEGNAVGSGERKVADVRN